MKRSAKTSKKLMSILLVACLLLSLMPMTVFAVDAPTDQWSNHAAGSFAGGEGTKTDPYQIATAAQLAKLAKDVNGGNDYKGVYFKLTDNIDLSAYRWNPIGVYFWGLDDTTISDPFAGILDGNEKTITGLYVDERSSCSSAGLFGEIRGTAGDTSVYDLTIEDAVVYASDADSTNTYAGIFAGMITANDTDSVSFENIKVSGTVVCDTYGYVVAGGMVGYTDRGHFTSCIADSVYISGSGNMGGFVGMDGEALFKNCVAKGEISGFWAVGGFSGYSYDATGTGGDDIVQSTFDHCYADVDVTATDWRAGGFVGYAEGGNFNNCVALGDVSSSVTEWEPKVGGFCGEIIAADMAKCHAGGVVTSAHATSAAGGFIGYDAAGNDGSVSGSSFDVEKNSKLNAVGVVDAAGQHSIVGAPTKNVLSNICRDYYGKTAHVYDNSKDLDCNACGFVRLEGKILIHGIDLVNGEEDHTIELGNGTAAYDEDTRTLTLTNAEITQPSDTSRSAGIYINSFANGVTIKLVGENKITLTDEAYDNNGIWNDAKVSLTICGSGSLDVITYNDYSPFGIWNRYGDVTLKDASVKFTLADGHATNGFLTDVDESIFLENAVLTAQDYAMGLFSNTSVAISGSEVTLSMLENGIFCDGDVTIDDSKVTIDSIYYEGICSWGDVVIASSELNATSQEHTAVYCYGKAIVSDSELELVSEEGDAFCANGGITVTDDSAVEVHGQGGAGIYTNEVLDVKSGTVSAKGKNWAILATRVSGNAVSEKPTDAPEAIIIGAGLAEENGHVIKTEDWAVRSVWDDWDWEYYDKWQSRSYYTDKDGNTATSISIVQIEDVTITENTANTTVTYDGSEIDLAKLFDIDANAGSATYTVTNGTGIGTQKDGKLTVTKAGTFTVKIDTAANGKYEAGTLTVMLTVNPKMIGIQWGETSFTYKDGTVQLPDAMVTGAVSGDVVTLTVVADKESIDVGAYTATVTEIVDGVGLYILPADGLSVTFTISNAGQEAPAGLVAVAETVSGKVDGKIEGLTADMEYSTSADGEYTKIVDPEMAFAPGTYFIRYSAKDNYDPSSSIEITIEAGRKLIVTFMVDGEVYGTLSVDYNDAIELPEIPEKVGYTQTAPIWDKDGKNITADTEINAVYTINKYTVTYKAGDEVVATVEVEHGKDATTPTVPAKDGFVGEWDKDGKNITADTAINAVYTANPTVVPGDSDTGDDVTDPSNPENPDAGDDETNTGTPESPQTGDDSNFVLWFVLFLVSGMGLVGTILFRKTKKAIER